MRPASRSLSVQRARLLERNRTPFHEALPEAANGVEAHSARGAGLADLPVPSSLHRLIQTARCLDSPEEEGTPFR